MIALSTVIERFEAEYLAQRHPNTEQRQALGAFKRCRTRLAPGMLAQCSSGSCNAQRVVPHSCGHRHCPHCQHFESQRWIERQTQQLVSGPYFLITFTLPSELRSLARAHPRIVYAALMECAWQTLREFSHNHRQLRGCPGAVAVLHTHSRALALHPHVHLAMPAAALDTEQRLWRRWRADQGYLFNHKALAKVFRGKLLASLQAQGLSLPAALPQRWVVDCKRLDQGAAVMVYLGRYLYRGVIQEKDILRCDDTGVTYRWRDSKTGQMRQRSVSGADFLRLVLQHVLPKGFRRARNYGFLHPNAKRMAALLRLLVFKSSAPTPLAQRPVMRCTCCGALMRIVRRHMPARATAQATTRPSTRPATQTSAPPPGGSPQRQGAPA